jgi:hypothetical protein
MIAAIGAELIDKVEDAASATHVIAGDDEVSLRRTPKLMIGICVTSNIVHMDWLTQSAKKREVLPCKDFLLLSDKVAEKKYQFKMRDTLTAGRRMQDEGRTLLGGKSVYVCKGVAGNKAPPENELKLIVEAAGGEWVSKASALGRDVDNELIITNDPAPKKQLSAKDVAKVLKKGVKSFTTTWLFDCIMKQQLIE